MDESEIEKIVEKTLDIRRKNTVHKFFHNPNNAEGLCLILGVLVFGACMFAVLNITDSSDDTVLVDSLLDNMNCENLKDVYKDSDLSWSQSNQVKKYMLVECL